MNKLKLFALLLAVVCILFVRKVGAAEKSFDVVVYGATPGGIAAAISAADEGAEVLLIEPTRFVGGMMSGGLGWTDFGNKATIGGWTRSFFYKIKKHYDKPESWTAETPEQYKARAGHMVDTDIFWSFEPKVAERTFEKMLQVPRLTLVREQRIVNVEKAQTKILSVRTDKDTYSAKVFIDATYEGDLLALAGVSFNIGRESRETYGESLARMLDPSVHEGRKYHHFDADLSPYDEQGKLLPGIQIADSKEIVAGKGDKKVQAYCFRICLTDFSENRLPITEPAGYDVRRYEILTRYLAAKPKTELQDILKLSPVPNRKTDTNNHHGGFSIDLPGVCWTYTEGDVAERERVWKDYESFTKGLLYFLGHDTRVPEHVRTAMLKWGYPKDEYTDRGNWSHQLYVREARRMLGGYVMTQADCSTQCEKSDSIGMGSYSMDSHIVQRMVTSSGFIANEGNFFSGKIVPYEIPYRSIVPKRDECTNLLVPVSLSASHVAFGSIRMEPNWMMLGESSGVAAQQMIKAKCDVQDLDVPALQARLLARGQRLTIKPQTK